MKTPVVTLLAAVLTITSSSCAQSRRPLPDPAARSQTAAEQTSEHTDEIVQNNSAFALDLYRQLADQPGFDNLFFSPFSISVALAMVYAGAEGQTAGQIADTLNFLPDQQAFHPALGRLETQLNEQSETEGVQLHIANALWLQQDFTFRRAYLDRVRENYAAALEQVSFLQNTEAARQKINRWVEQKTNGKITDLLPQGAVTNLTRLVLTNAVYFKGDWARPFDSRGTEPMPFTLQTCSPADPSRTDPNPETVSVPMMHREDRFPYAENDQCQILQLPYAGDELGMVILLPKQSVTLCDLAQNLTAEQLKGWMQTLQKQRVDVYFPRFEMNYKVSLKDTLTQMGMPLVFTPKADLTGIADADDLHIDAVIHKAYVKVDEKGTEAAAAIGITVGVTAVPAPPPVFKADRPFLFLIQDNATGTILFLGRLANPTG